jgi:hypothetical protein
MSNTPSLEKWIIDKIKDHDNVDSLSFDNGAILIQREEDEEIQVAALAEEKLLVAGIQNIPPDTDFVLNVPSEAYASGAVLNSLKARKIVYGGMGDLNRVLSQKRNWPYTNPEVKFILRGIGQHSKVKNIERIDTRRYKIERKNMSTVTILALNDYDMSVESVRNGKDVYKSFDIILTSNPNARVSSSASTLAKSLGIKILSFGDLLRELNFK